MSNTPEITRLESLVLSLHNEGLQQHKELCILKARITRLEAAAQAMLDKYVELAGSGDCGDWDPETDPEVIAVRSVLREGWV